MMYWAYVKMAALVSVANKREGSRLKRELWTFVETRLGCTLGFVHVYNIKRKSGSRKNKRIWSNFITTIHSPRIIHM
jgi:hypothetical protein